ncbi:retinol dehydrogenase [Verticillium alfalfae VaMs.102]|uniref:Retinol dehydrogenase n=1 Tax=Verticillium alfalfae (strain VaMs.102 / ATCC MYA-4576 / FGSC 10136) TaxID=526221 RepID=C9SWW7_VERA1|nr:retinol dehydrogenase [Verticillium alfalfae VaMs.102]EEY23508.1 retinol dehydrogenase [Verticillium alfalfae VaMs.102]
MVNFNPDQDIPDLSGKVILVTGGNNGLGKETVLQLCKHNPAMIFLAARSESKALDAIADIRRTVADAAPITYLRLDLASFDSIKKAVVDFHAQADRLDLLINNAGICAQPPGTTKDGYEIHFGTNHLGHALLTKLLLPTLLKTAAAPSPPPHDVRIITVASSAEAWAPFLDPGAFDTLKTNMTGLSGFARYSLSKHPGVVNTNIANGVAASWPILAPLVRFVRLVGDVLQTPVATGVKTQLWAAVSPEAESGEFYFPVGVPGKASKHARDREMEEALWAWTERELERHMDTAAA